MKPILRYQDREGRGPFRPGMTAKWADKEGANPVPMLILFPELRDILPKLHAKGLNVGCACDGVDGIMRYFTPAECVRLYGLGYRLHIVPRSAVILSHPQEVVFATRKPFRELPLFHKRLK